MNMQAVLDRIDERLDVLAAEAGKRQTDRALSLAAGLSADAIRNWRRAVREGREAGANATSLHQIARALGVSETWIMHGPDTHENAPAIDLTLLDEAGRQQLLDYFEFLLQRRERNSDENQP